MANLKELLLQESSYPISDALITKFISLGDTVKLKKKEVLIQSNSIDDNIYLLKDGMIKFVYQDGTKDVTPYFAFPGSLLLSYRSFCEGKESVYKVVACCESVVLRIRKSDYIGLMETSHAFALWIAHLAFGRLSYLEHNNHVVNGDARERLISLMHNQRDILQRVSSKTIASYLGITPSYLCRLRKQILEEERESH